MTRPKVVFKTVQEALRAMTSISQVTYTAKKVWVSTKFGMGTFDREMWDQMGGPGPSIQPAPRDDGPISA